MLYTVCPALFAFFSEEDNDEPLDWLPIAPEVEDPEEPGWGQLEVGLLNISFFAFECS